MFRKKKSPEQRQTEALLLLMNVYATRTSQTWRTPEERSAYRAAGALLNHALDSNVAGLARIYQRDLDFMYVKP